MSEHSESAHSNTERLSSPTVAIREATTDNDFAWVIDRQGAVYLDEFGWNADYEALVAEIVRDYRTGFVPGRENAWIAEVNGERAGCVFCCQRDDDTAQLRLLFVEPAARGLRLGRQLVEHCIAFAVAAGYAHMTLWTNSVLIAARRIYVDLGFTLDEEEPHHSFGQDLVGQTWSKPLT